MALSFDQLLQDLVNKDDEEKIAIAVDAYKDLLPVLTALDPKTNGIFMTMLLLGVTAGADGKLTVGEARFIHALMEARGVQMTDEKILAIVENANHEEAYDILRELRGRLTDDGVASLFTFIAAICSMDDTISREEIALLKAIL